MVLLKATTWKLKTFEWNCQCYDSTPLDLISLTWRRHGWIHCISHFARSTNVNAKKYEGLPWLGEVAADRGGGRMMLWGRGVSSRATLSLFHTSAGHAPFTWTFSEAGRFQQGSSRSGRQRVSPSNESLLSLCGHLLELEQVRQPWCFHAAHIHTMQWEGFWLKGECISFSGELCWHFHNGILFLLVS